MIPAACVLGLVYGLLRHGHWQNLLTRRLAWFWLPICSVLPEALVASGMLQRWTGQSAAYPVLHLLLATLQYSMILTFLLRNRSLPGTGFLLAGSLLNAAVILANGGRMPISSQFHAFSPAAVSKIQAAPHYLLAAGPEPLLWLGDWLPVWFLGWYMASPGDCLLSVGIFILAAGLVRIPPQNSKNEPDRSAQSG